MESLDGVAASSPAVQDQPCEAGSSSVSVERKLWCMERGLFRASRSTGRPARAEVYRTGSPMHNSFPDAICQSAK